MYINEYGSRDDPTVILLAPMMVSTSSSIITPRWSACTLVESTGTI